MQKTNYIYEIRKVDESSPLRRKVSTGVFFKDEKTAEEFIRKYVSKDKRKDYSIKERVDLPVYQSLAECERDNPIYEALKLEVMREELGEKEIDLPFAINALAAKGLIIEKHTDFTPVVITRVSLKELRCILKAARETLKKADEEELAEILNSDINFEIDGYISSTTSLKGTISYQEYKTLDKIYDSEFAKLKEISEKIHGIERANREDDESQL